jgi:hypothetical protein
MLNITNNHKPTENQLFLIEHAVKLGMDNMSAYILAECSEAQIEYIKNDKEYTSFLEVLKVTKEKELLELYHKHISLCAAKGNLKPIQWYLEKTNPGHWGKQNIKIQSDNKKPEDTEDDIKRILKEQENVLKELL